MPCPGCSGLGYLPSEITWDLISDQAAELEAALTVLRDLVDLLNEHEDEYLHDSRLFVLAFRAEEILAADETAPSKAVRRAV